METAVDIDVIREELEHTLVNAFCHEDGIVECRRILLQDYGLTPQTTRLLYGEDATGKQIFFGELDLWQHGLIVFDPAPKYQDLFSILAIQRPSGTPLQNIRDPKVVVRAYSLFNTPSQPGPYLKIEFKLRVSATEEVGPKYALKFSGATISIFKGQARHDFTIPDEHARMLDRWFDANL